ncbi:unnamed protein product [Clonostachys rhizophaga]|uniref:NAD-dependent epimerase/dehydratase domain-containing protein n=1 Tax=Clonostachys rhizophaga TaxID=160324 RepID=A0A9N9VHQ2_9HYPO|nr:unnamed protein product [Clonostachys rhizophaga]
MAAKILITGTSGLVGFRILVSALLAGHSVVATVRSEEKASLIRNNPSIQKLSMGHRLIIAVIPDMATDGAFDSVLEGVSHIIHTGSPVPFPEYEPWSQVYEPTISISSSLLFSALKTPTVRRVVITSSIVTNLGLNPSTTVAVSSSTRISPLDPVPASFANPMEAYVLAKIAEIHNTELFIKTQKPHFSLSYIMPGHVFGRNELITTADMMFGQNSSNNFLMPGMVGGELPFPIHGAFVHIDDLADIHLRVAMMDSSSPRDFGIARTVDYSTIFDHVEKAFPEAVAAGVLKRGVVPVLPVKYSSTEMEELLGRELKSFEEAVVDVAGQYLENLGRNKA